MRITEHNVAQLIAAIAFLFFFSDFARSEENVNARDHKGVTVLMRIAGAIGDDAESVKKILAQGADKDVMDNTGRTATMYAAEKGNVKALDVLIKNWAILERADRVTGDTALILAVRNGHIEAVRALLAVAVRKDTKNNAGETAKDVAEEIGREDIARLLQ